MPRRGQVAVEGALSEALAITNIVYQGTVLGPSLWNAFFQDIVTAVPDGNQVVDLFADDFKLIMSFSFHSSYLAINDWHNLAISKRIFVLNKIFLLDL